VPDRALSARGDATWAAVVINYETGPLLVDCVRSIVADTSAGVPEIVVVDNGSRDDSVAIFEGAMPATRVVHAPGNVGYSRAANLGIASTRADVVAVLNADTEIAPGTAAAMLRCLAARPEVGAVGPRVRNVDGTDYPSARSIPSLVDAIGHGALGLFFPNNRFTRRYRQLDADPAVARDVDWLSGSSMWLRRRALDDVGGWDERYFMYMEDVDLCWRLRRSGWQAVYEPAGAVMHVQGASTARHPYRMLAEHHRSAWRFAERRFTGPRRVLLPFAATYLTVRAAITMALHALRSRAWERLGNGPVASVSAPRAG
jgi:N-acetylglucosaminyl-diphospho-decaprenol L-rhamnosyltransferase